MPRGGSRRTKKRVKGGVNEPRRRTHRVTVGVPWRRTQNLLNRQRATALQPIHPGKNPQIMKAMMVTNNTILARKLQEKEQEVAAASAAAEALASTQAAERAVSGHLDATQHQVDDQMTAATTDAAEAIPVMMPPVPSEAEAEIRSAMPATTEEQLVAPQQQPPVQVETRSLRVKPNCLSQVGDDCAVCVRGYVPTGRAGQRECTPAWGSQEAARAAGKLDMDHCVTHHGDDCTTCSPGYMPVGVPGHRRCEPKRVAVDPASPMEHCVANVGNDCTICEMGYAPAGPNFNRRCVKVGQLWDGKRMNQEHRRGFMGWGGASRRRARPLSRGRRSRRAQKPRRG
jgi:hypothetical protein